MYYFPSAQQTGTAKVPAFFWNILKHSAIPKS